MLRKHQRDYASKMNLSFAGLLFFGCCLLQGIAALRLIKVVIPAYKLRGESALLECQYELNRSNSVINNSRSYGGSIGRGGYGIGSDGGISGMGSTTNINNNYRRTRNHQHQHYHHQLHDQQPAPQYKNHDEIRLRGHHYSSYDSGEQNDEGEALYSVKWYKDNEEIYRYVPKVNPPQQSYKVDGIRVDHQHSDSTRVLLRSLTLRSTGVYKCEVSAEAPNFSSVQGEGRMDVVYLPRDGPHISGKEDQYQIGDILSLNCSSGKSHPASHLQWFINDEPVIHSSSLIYYNNTVHQHGLVTSILGLQLPVDARHFQDGAMRVKCLASVSPILWQGDKESVVQRRPGLIDNREAMLLVLSSSSKSQSSLLLVLITTLSIIITCQLINSLPS